jgi:16S rRNA (guanine527-N7)-methyltransferase
VTALESRLEELRSRYELTSPAVKRLDAILDALAADPGAPTSVREPDRAVDVHLADSLVALELPEFATAENLADIGAGAGFPGLAIAAARPEMSIALVESTARKCEFIERTARGADLGGATAVCTRAEEWRDGLDRHDIVTARAVAPLAVLVEYAAPLLRVGGALIAWKGRRDPEDEAAGARAGGELGMASKYLLEVDPYPAARHRHLHVFTKVAPTPRGFPRRAGMAVKKPLGHARSDRTPR